jgi:hypothetical protein
VYVGVEVTRGISGRLHDWIAEARRRRVFRTAGVYVVAVWGISSGAVDIAGVLGIPEVALRVWIYAAVAFLPIVVLLAWRFDISRGGIIRDPQDVLERERAEARLAEMPTMLGGDVGPGAVVVRWISDQGEQRALFVDDFELGRGTDCGVRFYDPLVSRRHARVFHSEMGWLIEDLGSRNGTRVDGQPIECVPLVATCEVTLNEGGPVLSVEPLPPGAATQEAVRLFPSSRSTAHVRLSRAEVDGDTQEPELT